MLRQFRDKDIYLKELVIQLKKLGIQCVFVFQLVQSILLS